jgi:hypothetical protein
MKTATATTADSLAPETIEAKTRKFLNLKWVHQMYTYVRTMQGLNAPPSIPPDQPGMKTANRHGAPLLTIGALMERAKSNAGRWEPLLIKMAGVAGRVKNYATTSLDIIEHLTEKTKTQLNSAKYDKLSAKQKTDLKAELTSIINDLKREAETFKKEAENLRNEVLAYEKDIIKDNDESHDIQEKYKNWMKEEDKILAAWEKNAGVKPGETDKLIMSLEKDVATFTEKWAGLTGGAVGSAGAGITVGALVLPPLGTIAMLIGMSVMASFAAEFKKKMEEFKKRLQRVQKYNMVKIYFKTMDGTLTRMKDACEIAVEALGEVAGIWQGIANELQSLSGESNKIDALAGFGTQWEIPISTLKRKGADRVYEELRTRCDVFVQYLFVKDIKEVKISP